MLRNYYEIDENTSIEHFLKEAVDKKNSQYIILKSNPQSFVDIRTISLKLHEPNQKLRGFKKSLPHSTGRNYNDHIQKLINSGERLIKTDDGIFDFIHALKYILGENPSFLQETISSIKQNEVYAINPNDKISTARKLFIDKKINILPVIENLEVVGELRPRDFLVHSLFRNQEHSDRGNFYSSSQADSVQNLPISNIHNSKPHVLNPNHTLGEAVELMIAKSLPSIIVAESGQLHSVISYKDIFSRIESKEENFQIELVGASVLNTEDISQIREIVEKNMSKVTRLSNYDHIKLTFKEHGKDKQKKIGVKILLSHGNEILHTKENIGEGSTRNPVKLVQRSMESLGKKLKNTLNKK